LNAVAALFAAAPMLASAGAGADSSAPDTADRPMSVVVVSGSRSEHLSFDLPAAIDVVDAARIGAAQPRVNASEARGWWLRTGRTTHRTCRSLRAASAPAPPSVCAA
jgi:outer membrane receptor protein involved in Fe transport